MPRPLCHPAEHPTDMVRLACTKCEMPSYITSPTLDMVRLDVGGPTFCLRLKADERMVALQSPVHPNKGG